jgi:Spy/CpxP family protein refolding chaperone
MTEPKMVQTTIRIDAKTLYEARLALNLKGLNIQKFVAQKLEEVVQAYRQEQAKSRQNETEELHA